MRHTGSSPLHHVWRSKTEGPSLELKTQADCPEVKDLSKFSKSRLSIPAPATGKRKNALRWHLMCRDRKMPLNVVLCFLNSNTKSCCLGAQPSPSLGVRAMQSTGHRSCPQDASISEGRKEHKTARGNNKGSLILS